MRIITVFLLLFLTGCTPQSSAYRDYYAHLNAPLPKTTITSSPYFIVFLVNAPHLDYTDNKSFLRTMAKHPGSGSKEGDVGHAWIYLHGLQNGECHVIEGGHSGERGIHQPRYFEGIVQNIEHGCENPVSYLWESQNDGFFQCGNGGHRPTTAAKVNLTQQQYEKILRFIQCYQFQEYSLVGNQCASFVAQMAALIDFPIECQQTIQINSALFYRNDCLPLWKDPVYSTITVSTPDVIEKSLIQAIREGKAENVLHFYVKNNRNTFKKVDLLLLPCRIERMLKFHVYS